MMALEGLVQVYFLIMSVTESLQTCDSNGNHQLSLCIQSTKQLFVVLEGDCATPKVNVKS